MTVSSGTLPAPSTDARFLIKRVCLCAAVLVAAPIAAAAGDVSIEIDSPMAPPEWAVLQRELIRANTTACREFFDKYFDERGYLLCVERWGGDDGAGRRH